MSRPLRILAYDIYTAHRRRWLSEVQADHGLHLGWYFVLCVLITACLLAW